MENNFLNSGQADIKADNKGGFYVSVIGVGQTDSFGSVAITDPGVAYPIIARFRYDSIGCKPYHLYVGVQDIAPVMVNISIYPNPATGVVAVPSDIEFPLESGITIYDALGRTVYFQKLSGKEVKIDVSTISAGLYHCRIDLKGAGTVVKKLLVGQ